jgi:hypothetical protein
VRWHPAAPCPFIEMKHVEGIRAYFIFRCDVVRSRFVSVGTEVPMLSYLKIYTYLIILR